VKNKFIYCIPSLVILCIIVCATCGKSRKIVTAKETKERIVRDELLFPKPQNAHDEIILQRMAYVTSYNSVTRNPNWVAWRLIRNHTDGPYSRKGVPYISENGDSVIGIGRVSSITYKNSYIEDTDIGENHPHLEDYTGDYNMSHGHICPAGDNKWDKAAMNQSFLLSNMCPQDESLNGGGWKKLEEKCREWANRYGEIYIIAGPVFIGTVPRTMGKGNIAVPDAFFKVVLCRQGNPKAIGFIYENNSASQPMSDKVCSVDEVEKLTGFDFFSSLPDDIENAIESRANFTEW